MIALKKFSESLIGINKNHMFRRNFILSFVSGYFLGCLLFSITSSQNLSSPENEKTDLMISKDQIVLLNKNIH